MPIREYACVWTYVYLFFRMNGFLHACVYIWMQKCVFMSICMDNSVVCSQICMGGIIHKYLKLFEIHVILDCFSLYHVFSKIKFRLTDVWHDILIPSLPYLKFPQVLPLWRISSMSKVCYAYRFSSYPHKHEAADALNKSFFFPSIRFLRSILITVILQTLRRAQLLRADKKTC